MRRLFRRDFPWCGISSLCIWTEFLRANLLVLLVGLALLLFADLCTDRGLVLRERIATQGVWLRFLIEIGAICLILILGIWGASIQGDSFIYAQF